MITIPKPLIENLPKYYGDRGRAWIADLPQYAEDLLRRWRLAPDGVPMHGVVGLVQPVRQADSTPAVVKFQITDPFHPGESAALRVWGGDGAVRLLAEEEVGETATMLLERLDGRDLTTEPDSMRAVQIIAELLVRLHDHEPPPQARLLSEVAAGMLEYAPGAVRLLPDASDRRLVESWAAMVADVVGEPGDALLHWDLHFENVLAADREPWLAIDPKPLRGDPGFDLLPAVESRVTSPVEVLRRYDLMVEVLGLDRARADAWTVGRVLQNTLWSIEDGEYAIDPVQQMVASTVLGRS